jgi:hypothetical protein
MATQAYNLERLYAIISPNGESVVVTRELFVAMKDFRDRKEFGSITIEYRSGGIAGIKSLTERKYK